MSKTITLTALMLGVSLAAMSMAQAAPAAAVPQNTTAATAQPEAQKRWTINIQSADIRAFVSQVADMTGKNFVLDPRVRANDITVISRKALTAAEVYQLFLSVLQVNGYAAIPSGDSVKIVPSTTAKSYNLPLVKGKLTDSQGLVTEVLSLHDLSATEMVPVLRPLVPQYGHLAAVASANALVVSDHADNIRRLAAIIASLENQGGNDLIAIDLKNAWVGDVVKQLQTLIPQIGGSGRNNQAPGGSAVLVADERTNRLLVRGDAQTRHQIADLVAQLDVSDAHKGNIQVVRLNHGDAKDMATLLGKFFAEQKGAKDAGNPAAAVSIQADESLNALVVRADASKMEELRNIIRQLDVRRAQVLIEAAIIEVSADKARNLGVQWAAGDLDKGVGGTNFSNAGLSVNSILSAVIGSQSGATTAPPSLSDGLTAGFGELNKDGTLKWAGIVQALASNTAVNLLSTPSVLTLDNQEASIMVGQNVPFVTGESTSTGAGVSNPFQTIQRQDVGITLKVTPHLGEGDSMRLELDQEVSAVQPASSSVTTVDITTSKRQIKTTVLADSGQTIVLGGLIQDDIKKVVSKVPLLGDIPLLGALFRSTHNSHDRSNLIIFLRPTIVHDNDRLVALTRNKYLGLVSLQFKLNRHGELERVQKEPLPLNVDDVFNGRMPPTKNLQDAVSKQLHARPTGKSPAQAVAPSAPAATTPPTAKQAADTSKSASAATATPAPQVPATSVEK